MLGMHFRYFQKCLNCSIHKIMSPCSMRMDIYKSRREIRTFPINDRILFGRQ